MLIEENKPLGSFTTFGIGGPAHWFVEAASEEEIAEAAAWATERGVAMFVLGGGSNLLVSDAGFDGLVLCVGLRGIEASLALEQLGFVSGHDFSRAATAAKSTGALQAAEGLRIESALYQGTTSVVPQVRLNESRALAPEGCTSDSLPANTATFAQTIYQVAAGEDWDGFVQRAVDEDCAGIECLAGIPGTVGGTPVQNVGAYGQEVASAIERVRAFDLRERAFVEFAASECGFAYRRSRFNSTDRGRYVVTRVDYRLTAGGAPTVRYADLQRALAEGQAQGREASLAEVAAVVRRVRQSKGMLLVEGDPNCRSAGSFFKNPVVSEEQFGQIAALSEKVPPRFPAGAGMENQGRVKVPAAWLIEQAGFNKGYTFGAAGVSSRHTLALVNLGGASAAEILALANQITETVEKRFGIRLETEPVMVGF